MAAFENREIQENHKWYIQRLEFYKSFGYDTIAEREFVLDCAEPLEGRILEIGTGKGYLTITAARNGHELVTVEPSEEQLVFARLNAAYYGVTDKIDFRIGDVYSLEFPDATFDIVLFVNTYHHLDRAQEALEEMSRIIVPGGRIVLSDFTDAGFSLTDKAYHSEGYPHDRGKYPVGDSADRLKNMGFVNEIKSSEYQYVTVARKPGGCK